MVKTLLRPALRLAVVACAAALARRALRLWVDGPDPSPGGPPWAPVRAPDARPEPRTEPRIPPDGAGPPEAWVRPDPSGSVPATHVVKAKMGSRTYRVPGSPGYDRARPDRCYVSVEAAEADGFTLAKR